MRKYDPEMLCPLCGEKKPQTNGKKWIAREHIPPQSLFVDGTSDFITVPSCEECNNGTSKYDLDFQHAIGIYTGSVSVNRWKKTLLSLNKDIIRKKKKHNILKNTSALLMRTNAGWWGHQLKVEKQPIEIVVKKIVKGLHWHFTGNVLPRDVNVTIKFLRQGEDLQKELQDILNQYGKIHSIGNDSFSTHYAIAEDHDHASMWKLTFDQQDCFFAIIDPKRTKEQ